MGSIPTRLRHHIALRLNEARRLLRETLMSVIDVALEVGCANPSRFARLFRRETGLSPSDYAPAALNPAHREFPGKKFHLHGTKIPPP